MYIMMGIRIELSAVHTVNKYPAYVTGHEKTGLMCTKTKISFFALNSSAYKVTYLEKVSEESAAF